MFISTFNKLIRNRILWGIFAFIVVVSFVAWGTQTSSTGSGEDAAGKLDGKNIPAEQFRKEYFYTYLSMSLMFGQPLKVSEQLNELIRKLTWRRMAVLRKAAKLGLTVPADEVAGTIEQQPFFAEKGQFDRNRYQYFVQTFLAKLNASEAQFEEQVREELLINKARMLVSQAVWVAPMEIAQAFSVVYDTFVVSYVYLGNDDLRERVGIADADARKYFAAHAEDFKIPEMARVKYAVFPFSKYVDKAGLSAETLRSYYDEHSEDYSTKTTNGWSNPKPFEDVKDDIREQIAADNAISSAGDKALDFEVALAPDRSGKALSFEAAAKAIGAEIKTTALFSVNHVIPGLDAGLDFNQAAFNLRPTPEDYFSHPIRGSNCYFIIAYDKRIDAHLPEYEEVKDKVVNAAREQALQNEVLRIGRMLRNTAEKAIGQGKSFEAAMRPFGVEVVTTDPFSAKIGAPIDDEELGLAIMKTALTMNSGELSELIPLKNGVALAWVKYRNPGERAVLRAVAKDLGIFIKRKRAETLFYEWQEYLLKQANFEDRVASKPAPEAPGDDSDSEETDLQL